MNDLFLKLEKIQKLKESINQKENNQRNLNHELNIINNKINSIQLMIIIMK